MSFVKDESGMMSVLKLESDQGKTASFEASLRHRTVSERSKRAFRVTWPWLLVAVIGALVPILHFVIVPGAIAALLFFGVRELTSPTFYELLETKCPHCGNPYSEKEVVSLPKRLTCFSCRVSSTLTLQSPGL